jgi:hypothetical protein
LQAALAAHNPPLISSFMQLWFVCLVSKYLHFSSFSEALLAVLTLQAST